MKEDKLYRRRLRSAYLTTTVSLSLVLFLLGIIGLFLLSAKELSEYVKENIGFTVIMEDNIKEVDLIRLRKTLDASAYVKSTEEITKEKAAEQLRNDLGEDFIEFLGYNPLPVSIDVRLNAAYANPDSIEVIKKDLAKHPEIREFFYQPSLIDMVNKNIRKISMILLGFCALLFVISVALINNTIRLTVYSKRFIIKTMQLVGATRGFIRRPLLYRSAIQGLTGAVLAIVFLTGAIDFLQKQMEGIIGFHNGTIILCLFAIVIVLGIIITWISTFFAVNKYLRLKADNLYY
ncbi:MAG: permease-like cell division protein FtsX [Bacteroidetes bacterium]|nr:permease-like cell division protein FtsX [Bacteroidota bacterium]